MKVFLEDAAVPLDTNHLEFDLDLRAARGFDPWTYLVDVLQRLEIHPASKVNEPTPRIWKEKFGETPYQPHYRKARQYGAD